MNGWHICSNGFPTHPLCKLLSAKKTGLEDTPRVILPLSFPVNSWSWEFNFTSRSFCLLLFPRSVRRNPNRAPAPLPSSALPPPGVSASLGLGSSHYCLLQDVNVRKDSWTFLFPSSFSSPFIAFSNIFLFVDPSTDSSFREPMSRAMTVMRFVDGLQDLCCRRS